MDANALRQAEGREDVTDEKPEPLPAGGRFVQ
jgi:hypothetical protein